MEKYAFEIVDEAIEKYAKSYDAKRKKQYWQMLKKIHGGNDEAIKAMIKKDIRDDFSGAEHIKNMLIEPNVKALNRPKKYSDKFSVFAAKSESAPSLDGRDARLKTPSELWGSKTLYPKTTKFSQTGELNINPRAMDEMTRDVKYRGASNAWSKYKGKSTTDEQARKLSETIDAARRAEPSPGRSSRMIVSRKMDVPEELLITDADHRATYKKFNPFIDNRGSFKKLEEIASEKGQKIVPPNKVKPPSKKIPSDKVEQVDQRSTKSKKGAGAGAGLGLIGMGALAKNTLKNNKSIKQTNKLRDRTIPALAGAGIAGAAYGYGTDKAAFEIVNDILSK